MTTPAPGPAAVFVLSAAEPVRGMERAALEVVEALRADGVRADVAVLTSALTDAQRRSRLHRVHGARAFAASFLAARRLVRADGPPLVLVGIWVALRALPWATSRSRPVVGWEHSLTPQRRALSRFFDLVARLVLPLYRRRATAVVAVSATVAAALAEHPGTAAKTVVVANPVPEAPLPDAPLPDAAGPPSAHHRAGPPRLLYVGGLEPLKNPGLLLELLAELDGVRLDVAGTGRAEAALRQRAHDLGVADRAVFHGFTDRVPQLLASADVLVHPSLSETFGYALVEAAQAHVPVVAVSTPQSEHLQPELVPGRTCAPTAAAMADAVRAVLADPPGPAAFAAADRARAQEFSPAALVAAWRRVLTAAAGPAESPSAPGPLA